MGRGIKGTTRVCGLIGDPVHHTLSPAIHNTIAEEMGIDMVYVPFEVKGERRACFGYSWNERHHTAQKCSYG